MTFTALWALFAIDVITSSYCPSVEQVAEHLQVLAFDPQRGDHGDVRIDEDASGVRITWFNADGSPTFSKLVPAPSDCEGKAHAAAVVIAAHQAEIPLVSMTSVNVAQTEPHRQEPAQGNRFHFGAGAGAATGQ